jgi:hypothetical protein
MDKSALLSALNSLDTSWSGLEFWLWVCTSVVVAGVVIEVVVVIWERRHDLREFRRGTIHTPERPPTYKYVWELLGAALVALGVLGELVVGISAEKVETEMRDKTTTLVSLIDGQTEKLEKDAESLRKQAEDEKLKRVKIEQLLHWRSISPEQARIIRGSLSPISGDSFSILYNMGDAEGAQYADELLDTLKLCGWPDNDGPGAFMGGGVPLEGIMVLVRGRPEDHPQALALLRALESAHTEAKGAHGEGSGAKIELFVDTKPRPKINGEKQ